MLEKEGMGAMFLHKAIHLDLRAQRQTLLLEDRIMIGIIGRIASDVNNTSTFLSCICRYRFKLGNDNVDERHSYEIESVCK